MKTSPPAVTGLQLGSQFGLEELTDADLTKEVDGQCRGVEKRWERRRRRFSAGYRLYVEFRDRKAANTG